MVWVLEIFHLFRGQPVQAGVLVNLEAVVGHEHIGSIDLEEGETVVENLGTDHQGQSLGEELSFGIH